MTTLTPDDFSAAEKAEIEARLATEAGDLAFLVRQEAAELAVRAPREIRESAHTRIHDANILELLNLLLIVVQDRDTAEPTEAPHFIRFGDPPPATPSEQKFPIALADMSGTGLPGTIPSYTSPFGTASIANGNLSTNTGGWELWHYDPIGMVVERDPNQPSLGELNGVGDYDGMLVEFADVQNFRLHGERGSFVLLSQNNANIAAITGIATMLQERNDKYREIGFPEGSP